MTDLAKKLSAALLTVVAAVCLAFGLLFIVPQKSTAAETATPKQFSAEGDFIIAGGVLQGLSNDAITQIQDGSKFTVTVPAGVTSIAAGSSITGIWGNYASNLTSVTLSSDVKTIGNNAFCGCTSLATLNFGSDSTLTTIGEYAFDGSAITELVIPQTVETIERAAFRNCTALGSVTYSGVSHLDTIGAEAFQNCSSLTAITIPKSVVTINNSAFSGCSSVTAINFYAVAAKATYTNSPFANINNNNISVTVGQTGEDNKITELPANLFRGSKISAVRFVNVNIGGDNGFMQIFADCTNLKNVTFDDNSTVSQIGYGAFYNCVSLYKLDIPGGVTVIDPTAFTNCTRLVEIYSRSSTSLANFPTAMYTYTTANATKLIPVGDYIYYVNGNTVLLVEYTGREQEITLPANYEGKTYTVHVRAFAGNTALRSIVLPQGITTISASTFEGCTSLQSIDIPSSVTMIENSAFKNCSSLSSVKFNKTASSSGSAVTEEPVYKLNSIDYNAFEGCANLSVIQIPDSVTSLGAQTFLNCTRLNTVYLPAYTSGNASYSNMFDGTARNLILIAPDSASYGNYSGRNLGTAGNYTLTYVITLNLHSVDESENDEVTKDYRLHGMDYTYVKNTDASWSSTGGMPVQAGYKTSVWYKSNTFSEAQKLASLTGELENNIESLDLYAHKLSLDLSNVALNTTPASEGATAPGILIYDDNDASGLAVDKENLQNWYTGISDAVFTNFSFSISSYHQYYTPRYETKNTVKDAGMYTISANISDAKKADYGEWATGVAIPEITVFPKPVQLSSDLIWVSGGGNRLLPTSKNSSEDPIQTLYIYNNIPYISAQDNLGTADPVSVSYSYLMYSGAEVSIKLQANSGSADGLSKWISGSIAYNSQVKGQGAGVYNATATVTMNNNYSLAVSNDEGQHISVSNVGNVFTVYKTWYIATNAANMLLNSDGTPYSIADWTYNNATVNPAAQPKIAHGEGQGATVDYTLKMYDYSDSSLSNAILVVEFTSANAINSYINKSMPAGRYVLVAEVSSYKVSEKEIYSESTVNIEFNVNPAEAKSLVNSDERADIDLYRKDVKVNYNNGTPVQFLGDTNPLELLSRAPEQLHPTREGYWTNNTVNWIDDNGKEITFNIAALYTTRFQIEFCTTADGEYHTQSWYNDNNQGFSSIGSNRVYYNLYAPSYKSTDDLFGRGNNYYNLVITHLINAPAISIYYKGSAYTESEITSIIGSEFYDIKLVTTDAVFNAYQSLGLSGGKQTYINAGAYDVILVLKNEYLSSCSWGTGFAGTNNGAARLRFRINPAQNYTTLNLTMNGWEYGRLSSDNLPIWVTQYGNVNQQTFRLVKVGEENDTTAGYYANKSDINSFKNFNEAPVGNYYLIGTMPSEGNNNYGAYTLERDKWVTIHITPSEIVWETAPYIESFRYENDDTHIVTEGTLPAYLADQDLKYTTFYAFKADVDSEKAYTDSSLRFDTIAALAESLGYDYLPAGNYAYVYMFEKGENNLARNYPVYFNVIATRNYWDIAPVIQGWLYGEYSGLNIEYAPHFGKTSQVTFQFRYIDENGVKYAPKTKLEDYMDGEGQLPVGTYEYQATVRATDNYTELKLTSDDKWLSFKVDKSQNSWVDIPNIIGWSETRFKSETNLPTAKSQFGNVYYTIKDADGNEIISNVAASDLSASTLGNLEVGNYTLVASVAGTADYYELSAEAHFAVFEDSVGMTGLIAATMVFAVIAIGLAVCGAVLLIRRNKKIEEEFRKMVKSELRRK